jgi:hypothetical protein
MKLRVLVLALAVCSFLALPACGGDDETTTSDDQTAAAICPAPETNPPDPFDANELVGMSLADAEDAARQHGCSVRVTERDGEQLPATLDLQPDRIGVAVTDDEVVAITGVG